MELSQVGELQNHGISKGGGGLEYHPKNPCEKKTESNQPLFFSEGPSWFFEGTFWKTKKKTPGILTTDLTCYQGDLYQQHWRYWGMGWPTKGWKTGENYPFETPHPSKRVWKTGIAVPFFVWNWMNRKKKRGTRYPLKKQTGWLGSCKKIVFFAALMSLMTCDFEISAVIVEASTTGSCNGFLAAIQPRC